MTAREVIRRHDHLTFKGNLRDTRYGWLRLTPAYSVHLVADLLDAQVSGKSHVLDPFCGTGTTALVCAERGIACDTTDINPFLLWLTAAKTRPYPADALAAFHATARDVRAAMMDDQAEPSWIPPLHQIEKWWDAETLHALGQAMAAIKRFAGVVPSESLDLLKITFCRTMIERSNASFGHQSMSFKKRRASVPRSSLSPAPGERDMGVRADSSGPPQEWGGGAVNSWHRATQAIAHSAQSPIHALPRTFLCDARNLTAQLAADSYDCVITSPPYPNRMSYIRELRPYMYWLGYLQDGRQAGELDWQAIGGTWGVATSNVAKWAPAEDGSVPYPGFDEILRAIAERSPVLSRYVHKYFMDMVVHVRELFQVVRPGGTIHYIVGNSRFYDVLVPVEEIFAALFAAAGFTDVTLRVIRKRTSKKELFEYLVSARKPALRPFLTD